MSNSVRAFTQHINPSHDDAQLQAKRFEADLFALFTKERQGHMEQWSYENADYPGDPASGAYFWEQLCNNPGPYYLPQADYEMLAQASRNPVVQSILKDTHTVVELGAGCAKSTALKTIPLLSNAKKYISVDNNEAQARQAAEQINRMLGIPTSTLRDNYLHPDIPKAGRPKTGFFMWGAALGNVEGGAGTSPLPHLVQSLSLLADCCNDGDSVFISVDTETRAEYVLNAYNTPLMAAKILSLLYHAARLKLVYGHFTPASWTYRLAWHESAGQGAHYLIAGEDQDFLLAGKRICIKAGQSFIAINSYKYRPDMVEACAKRAGFRRVVVSNDRPMALLIATK